MRTPYNAHTGDNYHGGNVASLLGACDDNGFTDPCFATFNQWRKLGRCVSKGQKHTAKIRKVVTVKATKKRKAGKTLRSFCVFHVSQTEEVAAPVAA